MGSDGRCGVESFIGREIKDRHSGASGHHGTGSETGAIVRKRTREDEDDGPRKRGGERSRQNGTTTPA